MHNSFYAFMHVSYIANTNIRKKRKPVNHFFKCYICAFEVNTVNTKYRKENDIRQTASPATLPALAAAVDLV